MTIEGFIAGLILTILFIGGTYYLSHNGKDE